MKKPIYLLNDAQISGLGAILHQGNTIWVSKPVAIASRATNMTTKKYPQLDPEAMAIAFVLRRFRVYLAGAPNITIITDHKQLCTISSGKKTRLNSNESYERKASKFSV